MSEKKTKVAIIGSGNIGTDLMIKVTRHSDVLEMGAMVGIDPESDGLARAKRMGVATTAEGVEGFVRPGGIPGRPLPDAPPLPPPAPIRPSRTAPAPHQARRRRRQNQMDQNGHRILLREAVRCDCRVRCLGGLVAGADAGV